MSYSFEFHKCKIFDPWKRRAIWELINPAMITLLKNTYVGDERLIPKSFVDYKIQFRLAWRRYDL